jgi:putative spermidine/putrescine transport system permease protein
VADITETSLLPENRKQPRRAALDWLGLVPFMAFAVLFLLYPTAHIVIGAFRATDGGLTLDYMAGLFTPNIIKAFTLSLEVSLLTAGLGLALGLALALAVVRGGLPGFIRSALLTFSGVASQFAGVPLAFAFIATLGRLGFVTVLLKAIGIDLYGAGFNLITLSGLVLVYLYFQIPLMVLIITPAIDGLRTDWAEAAESLGATTAYYWRRVALPVLWPSLAGSFALLFANAFGAVATAMALTGSSLSLMPILLFAQIRGDVLNSQQLGYAIACLMIAVTGIANLLYIVLRARADRWTK